MLLALTAILPTSRPPSLLQVSPLGVAGGFVLLATLSTLVANTAAYYVLGDAAEFRRAPVVGVATALVALSLVVLPPYAVILLVLVVDFAVISVVYELDRRRAAMITAVHYALTVILALTVQFTLGLYQTAPG